MRLWVRLLSSSVILLPLYAGCATAESIDSLDLGDAGFPQQDNGGGPNGTGGIISSGGAMSAGGMLAAGGAPASGGVASGGAAGAGSGGALSSGGAEGGDAGDAGPSPCTDPTQKLCAGMCVTPNPNVGCDPTACAACPAGPANGFASCANGKCGFGCLSGFVANGSACTTPPASCTNGKKDGTETDVDCGGTACPKCAAAKTCTTAADCESAVCQGGGTKTCREATCSDQVMNGTETDVDCGGGAPCSACSAGKACKANGDCATGPCKNNVCSCTPLTVCPAGSCGKTVSDNCNGTLDCSTNCKSPQVCNTNACCTPLAAATACAGKCGNVSDGCGGNVDCGTGNCTSGQTCNSDGVCACGVPPSVNVDATQWSSKFSTSPVWGCTAAGTTTIDSAAGTITSTSCTLGTLDFTNDVAQLDASGPKVMVVRLRGLTVSGGHVLKLVGDKPIVLLVSGNVLVDSGGIIDASASGTTAGPGGSMASVCGGQTGSLGTNGGSGGGFGTAGGCGGSTANGCGVAGGVVSSDTDLRPLRGGCSGGSGTSGGAGAGGGAVEISASGTITIGKGANAGVLTAGGGAGQGATGTNSGAGGGGSGGGILLVSPASASFGSAGAARVHGGGGGEGKDINTSRAGADGHSADNTAAAGGNGGSAGGDGGDGGLCAGNSCSVTSASGLAGVSRNTGGDGGGGGGGGRIQVITAAAVCM